MRGAVVTTLPFALQGVDAAGATEKR